MYVLSLFLYAFLVIYVLSIALRYYSSRYALKKRERTIRKELIPVRKADPSEIVGLRQLFGVWIPARADVYRAEGAVESLTIKGRYSNYREFWVGGIQIQNPGNPYKSQVGSHLEKGLAESDFLKCEFVLDTRGKAFPVSINSQSISTSFTEKNSFTGRGVQPRWRLRDATPRERQALIKPVRWPAILLLLPTAPLFLGSVHLIDTGERRLALFLLAAVLLILSFLIQARQVPSRKGEGQICSVTGDWKQIKSTNPFICRYALKGTDIQLSLSMAARRNISEEKLRGEIDIYFKKQALTARVHCKLIQAGSYCQDQRLRFQIIKAPRSWMPFYMILLLSGLSVFSATMNDKPWNLLALIPENLKNGPRILKSAEDTLRMKEGETIRFEGLLIKPVNDIIKGGFLPLDAPMDLFSNPDPGEQELTESLMEYWKDFSDSMNRLYRYTDGSRLEMNIEQFYHMNSKAVVCINPEGLMQYLSRDQRYTARMPLDDLILNQAYSGSAMNWLVQYLAIHVKMGIYREALKSWGKLQLSHFNEKLRSSPYPLLIYSDDPLPSVLDLDKKVEEEENLYLLPIDELIKRAYESESLSHMDGEYYLYSPKDYSASSYNLKEFRPFGFIGIKEFTLFLNSILISLAYMTAGLLLLTGSVIAQLRE